MIGYAPDALPVVSDEMAASVLPELGPFDGLTRAVSESVASP
jgi:hypothetical protein